MHYIGEALELRGHNVTLCTTEREGDELPKQLANRTRMTFLSAGPDLQQDVLEECSSNQNKSMFQVGFEMLSKHAETARRIAKKLRSDSSYPSSWDIMVVDAMLTTYAYLSEPEMVCAYIVTFKTIRYEWRVANTPQWPYPLAGTLYTANTTSSQRLHSVPLNLFSRLLYEYMKVVHFETIDFDCSEYYDHLIPAYLKYKWSWVQFYNIDVYALLLLAVLITVLIVSKMCSFCRRFSRKTKTE